MNGLERFMVALSGKEPDKVPVYELIINSPVIQKIIGKDSLPDLVEYLDLDGMTAVEDVEMQQVAPGIYRDEWGIIHKVGSTELTYPVAGPIKGSSDLENLKVPDPEADHRLNTLKSYVRRFKGKRAIVFLGHDAFEFSHYLMGGLDKLLPLYYRDPEFVHRLAQIVSDYKIEVMKRAAEEGADVLLTGDDYASNSGPLMAPKLFEEFVLPYMSRAVRVAHNNRLPFIKHTDGRIWKILDPIVEAGIDGLHPIEPHAGMDIGEVKRKYGRKICLVGNVDCTALLPHGSRGEIEEAVKETIAKASPGGGHIISSSNSIHPGVDSENFRSMIEAARKYGTYPLDESMISVYGKRDYMRRYRIL
mgnify:CR=1 FL=1